MPNRTPNYALIQPETTEAYDVNQFNENAEIIDRELKRIDDGMGDISASTTLESNGQSVEANQRRQDAEIAALQTGKAPTSHNHAASQITSGTLAAARLPEASSTAQGAIRIATDAEATAGTLTTVAVNPKQLQTANGGGKRYATLVVGLSTQGYTAADVDYLCDGAADQVEINAALAALPATGGKVLLLEGTYNIAASVMLVKDGTTLEGMGPATKLVRGWDGAATNGMVQATGLSNCAVRNIYFDGMLSLFPYASNVGVYYYSCVDSTVENNVLTACGIGVSLDATSGGGGRNRVIKNKCVDNYHRNIYISYSPDSSIEANICFGKSAGAVAGIFIVHSDDCTVAGNTCKEIGTTGIFVQTSANATISGNICSSNNIGIQFGAATECCVVTGNTCNNNASDGMYLNSCKYCAISGNVCYNNSVKGINLAGVTSSGNLITGNTVMRGTGQATDYSATQHTIYVQYSSNNLISDNLVLGKAVTDSGTNNTVINNKAT